MKTLVINPVKPDEIAIHLRPLTLKQMQELVGGNIELTYASIGGEAVDMVVNENGIAERLPENIKASRIHRNCNGDRGDFIVGVALVPLDWEIK